MTTTLFNEGLERKYGQYLSHKTNRWYDSSVELVRDVDSLYGRFSFYAYSDISYTTFVESESRYYDIIYDMSNNNGSANGYGVKSSWSFTGKHICTVELDHILNDHDNNNIDGLIVESTSRYMNFSSSQPEQIVKPSIDDSVPIVTLSNEDKSKKVFGVISGNYDNRYNPHTRHGFNYTSIYQNENRHEINSIGEGGIWICNKNGPLENGDFISSSTVPGYGMVQDDDLNHNYTVGKITCDCDFSLTKVKQSELVYTLDASDNKILTYDEKGHVQYKDLVDESGNVIYDYPLFTRFVQADGTILEDQTTYESKKAANEEVYIACFVGCVYMCG